MIEIAESRTAAVKAESLEEEETAEEADMTN